MNVATRITPSRITAEEMERRRKMVQSAVHSNAMEGARHCPDVDPIFDAFINGDIEVTEILPLIKKLRKFA
ncbi:MAG: antitoxin VbhA family protein [Alphaproteobacteria bacterium]|nr:antitoxin VbhA family protein [Alphaproteobacteria bacterium]